MKSLLCQCVILAGRDRLDGMFRSFRERKQHLDQGDLVTGLSILAGVILAIWLLSWLLARQEQRHVRNSGLGLFVSLCRAHQLRLRQWWLLWRVARHHKLRDPARVFLEPERLDPDDLSTRLQARAEDLADLRDQLFSDLEGETRYHPLAAKKKKKDAAASEAEPSEPNPGPVFPKAVSPSLEMPPWPPWGDTASTLPTSGDAASAPSPDSP
jgi:hypothetical protein